jgi:hypothetical protein
MTASPTLKSLMRGVSSISRTREFTACRLRRRSPGCSHRNTPLSSSKRGGVIMPVRPGGQTETPNDSLARGLNLAPGSWRRIYSLQSGRVFRDCVT